jgi:hypothetical protein
MERDMRKLVVCIVVLLVCLPSIGLAQIGGGTKDADANAVLKQLKSLTTGGVYNPQAKKAPARQTSARPVGVVAQPKRESPLVGGFEPVQNVTPYLRTPSPAGSQPSGTIIGKKVKTNPSPEKSKPPIAPKTSNPQSMQVWQSDPGLLVRRVEPQSLPNQMKMTRYFRPEEPGVEAVDSSGHLPDGTLARTFIRISPKHPQEIEIRLQNNESLEYGDSEFMSFNRIEDVPLDGILYDFQGRLVFLRYGVVCGLDGLQKVALAKRIGHQQVEVRKAQIVKIR